VRSLVRGRLTVRGRDHHSQGAIGVTEEIDMPALTHVAVAVRANDENKDHLVWFAPMTHHEGRG
jgi:hypothetical protein